MEIRVGLIDGDDDIRFGRRQIIDAQEDLRVIFEEGSFSESLDRAPQALIDVLVIDQRLRGGDGVSLTLQLVEKYLLEGQKPPSIILTGAYFSDELQLAAIRAGATDLVTQEARPEELLKAIRSTTAKNDQPNFAQLRLFLQRSTKERVASNEFLLRLGQLNEREKQVLDLFAAGVSQDEVAERLQTPKYRVRQILQAAQQKCGFATLSQLFLALFEAGMLGA